RFSVAPRSIAWITGDLPVVPTRNLESLPESICAAAPRMTVSDIDRLIQLLAKLPGLGPRSARRAALHLLKKRDLLMLPLARALDDAAANIRSCTTCGNLDTSDPCAVCADPRRDPATICVVADVADLWALERAGAHKGRYHVLGGTLSALDGIGPE